MSTPEQGGRTGVAGRNQRPSATPGALPDAVSIGSAASRAGGGVARLAAAAPAPGAAASSPPAATPGAPDAPRARLAALSLHTPGPVFGAAAGGSAPTARLAPLPSRGAGAAAASSPGAGASATSDGAVARGGGAPGLGRAASPTPAGNASVPGDVPPEPVGDDGAPLSAAAAASPFSPPASERHAAFVKLVDHALKAGQNGRSMRQADFSTLAAEAGVPLFGDDSIIVADLRACQAYALGRQSSMEPDPAEKVALQHRAWAVLLTQALPVLQSRLDKGTLLPGKLRRVEEAYDVYCQQTLHQVIERPVPGAATLQGLSCLAGYEAALRAARTALNLLLLPMWRSDERGRVQAFVLTALRLIPKTAGLSGKVVAELPLVESIERFVTADNYSADFCASVLAVWRSRAVADVLRARGSLQRAASVVAANTAEFEVGRKADLAKRGLRRCALPSCGKQEATVLQFRVCGHCQITRYCCTEHVKQHWKAHKREAGQASDGGAGLSAAA